MPNLPKVLILLGVICFILTAFGIESFGLRLLPLGLAFFTSSFLVT